MNKGRYERKIVISGEDSAYLNSIGAVLPQTANGKNKSLSTEKNKNEYFNFNGNQNNNLHILRAKPNLHEQQKLQNQNFKIDSIRNYPQSTKNSRTQSSYNFQGFKGPDSKSGNIIKQHKNQQVINLQFQHINGENKPQQNAKIKKQIAIKSEDFQMYKQNLYNPVLAINGQQNQQQSQNQQIQQQNFSQNLSARKNNSVEPFQQEGVNKSQSETKQNLKTAKMFTGIYVNKKQNNLQQQFQQKNINQKIISAIPTNRYSQKSKRFFSRHEDRNKNENNNNIEHIGNISYNILNQSNNSFSQKIPVNIQNDGMEYSSQRNSPRLDPVEGQQQHIMESQNIAQQKANSHIWKYEYLKGQKQSKIHFKNIKNAIQSDKENHTLKSQDLQKLNNYFVIENSNDTPEQKNNPQTIKGSQSYRGEKDSGSGVQLQIRKINNSIHQSPSHASEVQFFKNEEANNINQENQKEKLILESSVYNQKQKKQADKTHSVTIKQIKKIENIELYKNQQSQEALQKDLQQNQKQQNVQDSQNKPASSFNSYITRVPESIPIIQADITEQQNGQESNGQKVKQDKQFGKTTSNEFKLNTTPILIKEKKNSISFHQNANSHIEQNLKYQQNTQKSAKSPQTINQNSIKKAYHSHNTFYNSFNSPRAIQTQEKKQNQNKLNENRLLQPKQNEIEDQNAKQLEVNEKSSVQNIGEQITSGFRFYVSSVQASFKPPLGQDYFSQQYRQHFIQTCQGLSYGKQAKPMITNFFKKHPVLLGENTSKTGKTIVFDLDETLIHCNEGDQQYADKYLDIKFPTGEVVKAGIIVRPFLKELLDGLYEDFELILFTASHQCYANKVVDYIDPEKKYFKTRQNCVVTQQGVFIKDLRIFQDRNIQDIVLVDNAGYSLSYQPQNGIPILSFYDNKEDRELEKLLPYLKSLSSTQDVRIVNKSTFQLHLFSDPQGPNKAFEKIFLKN